jgi:hypothetical protein
MLSGISNPFGTDMQAASAVLCTSLGLLAGRKFCLAGGYKIGGAIADLVGKQNAAEWHQAGDDYMALAKKDAFRDVAAVAGFVGAVALARYAEESLTVKEEKPKPEEPGYFQSYAMPILKYGFAFGAGVVARKPLAKRIKGSELAANLCEVGSYIGNIARIHGMRALQTLPCKFPKNSEY